MKTKIFKIIKNDRPDVEEAVKNNGGYCPCAIFKTDDFKCMCKNFREMYEGTCHCGLYSKVLVETREEYSDVLRKKEEE